MCAAPSYVEFNFIILLETCFSFWYFSVNIGNVLHKIVQIVGMTDEHCRCRLRKKNKAIGECDGTRSEKKKKQATQIQDVKLKLRSSDEEVFLNIL